MRWFVLGLGLALCIVLSPQVPLKAQTPAQRGTIIFNPSVTKTITVTRNGQSLGELRLTPGTTLNISFDDTLPSNVIPADLLDGNRGARRGSLVGILDHHARVALHGDITIRTVPFGSPAPTAANEQLVLNVQNADVLVTCSDSRTE